MTKINNLPIYAKNYKYIVARLIDGGWWFYGAYNDGFKAEHAAIECNGEIFRNWKFLQKNSWQVAKSMI